MVRDADFFCVEVDVMNLAWHCTVDRSIDWLIDWLVYTPCYQCGSSFDCLISWLIYHWPIYVKIDFGIWIVLLCHVVNFCRSPDGTCLLANAVDSSLRLFNVPDLSALPASPEAWTSVLRVKEVDLVYDYCWYVFSTVWRKLQLFKALVFDRLVYWLFGWWID